ncbi:MAG TPA: GMC family oxidoreductase [Allosphingosinicella sp.]|nr:GMC family oxidoreductase [Allosphingosinicella sp.]
MKDGFDCDYIVVGSGAGGGTVAARLAEAGRDVILLEAGGDPVAEGAERFPCDYSIPAFHPMATENPAMAWDYWVEHYPDPVQAARDWKRCDKGILYPRAGTLGGCTAHNAMIFVTPQDSDWRGMAEATGDEGWGPEAMAGYQRKVEQCRHRPLRRLLAAMGRDGSGHGWDGWLPVERAMPAQAFSDAPMRETIEKGAWAASRDISGPWQAFKRLLRGKLDPNDRSMNGKAGLCYAPLATDDHCRFGTRERLRAVEDGAGGRLRIELHALVTRILFAPDGGAAGVEYRRGRHLYRASPLSGDSAEGGETVSIRARREVILAAGAFNTPQLLMLSGIGPRDELAKHGIEVRADLPVGRNLQDRYEVCVLHRLAAPWKSMDGADFSPDDPIGRLWATKRQGMYISNGAALAMKRNSPRCAGDADLFIMALLGAFQGYYPGYSKALREQKDVLSWAILKARTANTSGAVTLRSTDPRDPPCIAFNFFDPKCDPEGRDLKAVAAAVEMVREAAAPLLDCNLVTEEICPGRKVQGERLEQWIRDNAWGHHASCTCPMGPRSEGGVLDGRLKVHGVPRLRVVDASIFPRIPGYFIVSAIYMAAEKAADMILEDDVLAPAEREKAA